RARTGQQAASWEYIVTDHLGSVAGVTNASGSLVEQDSFDTWGRRRNADGTDNATCSVTSVMSRGYTGHEMLDQFCLINMNARIQDPTLGRFTAADSIVPDSLNGQAYNRFSYVYDNPLKYTDPSGHAVCFVCWTFIPDALVDTRLGQIAIGDWLA